MKLGYGVTFLLMQVSLLFGNGVQDANGYHNNSSLQWDTATKLINSISWQGNESVLDVGCGDGKITAMIASKLPEGQVIGLDVSDSMVKFASSEFSHDRFSNLDFLTGDAANLPFDQIFDVVVSFSTLHWVKEQGKALEGFYRALVPGGKAYLTTFGKAPMNLVTVCEKCMASDKWKEYFQNYVSQRVYFTEKEYRDILNKSGFTDINFTTSWVETIYPNRQALLQLLKPLINFIDHLSLELQNNFINEVVDEMAMLSKPTEDGSIIFKYLKFQVIAEKG